MWNGICTPMDRGCTSCPGYTKSRRSPPLLSASLPKHKPREQHECTNLMHSDLGPSRPCYGPRPASRQEHGPLCEEYPMAPSLIRGKYALAHGEIKGEPE